VQSTRERIEEQMADDEAERSRVAADLKAASKELKELRAALATRGKELEAAEAARAALEARVVRTAAAALFAPSVVFWLGPCHALPAHAVYGANLCSCWTRGPTGEAKRCPRLQEEQGAGRADTQAALDKLAAEEADLAQSLASIHDKMRSLGVAPGAAVQRHSKKGRTALQKELARVSKALAKFDKVNLKAMDECNTFLDSQAQLQKRREVRLRIQRTS
jgi:chromosome segregation ATPase